MFNATLISPTDLYENSSSLEVPSGPPPWYLYPECAVAPYGFFFYFGVKVFNLAVGTPCNILVIWHIVSKKSGTSTSDIFILNLAVLDAYFGLMTPTDLVNRLVLYDDLIWYFLRFGYGIKDMAPLFLVCICVDHYMAVVHPVIFSSNKDNMIRIGVALVVWVLTLAYALKKSIMGNLSVTSIFSGIILFAFAVMVFCNISIVWVLRRSVAGKEEMHPVKKRALKMVLINLAITVFNYLPPVALMPFMSYYTFVEFFCQISLSVFSIMDLSCSIEPLLYITKVDRLNSSCCRQCFSKRSADVKV
ncbi:atypical chemokine receptor 3 [Xenentodon cancila]